MVICGLITFTNAVSVAQTEVPQKSSPTAVPIFVTSTVGFAVAVYIQISVRPSIPLLPASPLTYDIVIPSLSVT